MFNERKTESALLHLYLSAGLTQKFGKNDFHFAFILAATAHMCCGITLASRKKLIYCILKFNPCLPEDNKERKLWWASDASLDSLSLLVTEFRFDAMLCSILGSENSDMGVRFDKKFAIICLPTTPQLFRLELLNVTNSAPASSAQNKPQTPLMSFLIPETIWLSQPSRPLRIDADIGLYI